MKVVIERRIKELNQKKMRIFRYIMAILWFCTTITLMAAIFWIALTPDISKDTLSLSILGLVISVITTIALVEEW